MIPAEIIKKKRDGFELEPLVIKGFIDGYVKGHIADYQMSAFLMTIFFNKMTKKELWALTESMLHSGQVIDLSSVAGRKIDKHSTGGVGDKTSLIIGPIAAAAGVKVPMISGRGLGHTGGTLDKLESIPGFNTQLSVDDFKKQISILGISFIGQTKDICPADKKMYALRDVTATVECIPLICASIMSKKLAEGIDGIVLDIKFGSGAFMKTPSEAKKLALGLIEIARAAKKDVRALLTNMDQVLGFAVGNSLEVSECLDVLNGGGPQDLRELSLQLSAHMILLAKLEKNIEKSYARAEEILDSGKAKKLFEEIVKYQGGDLARLPKSKYQTQVLAKKSGFMAALNVENIGLASLILGAGRSRTDDVLDYSAGIIFKKKIGDQIKKGEIIATLHHDGARDLKASEQMILEACEIRLQKTRSARLIKEVI